MKKEQDEMDELLQHHLQSEPREGVGIGMEASAQVLKLLIHQFNASSLHQRMHIDRSVRTCIQMS